MNLELEQLRYPIGPFQQPEIITNEHITLWISILENFPSQVRMEVVALDDIALEKQYRPNSWTIRQLVHHCADSHLNSFIRHKLALTETTPIVKPYDENSWAELSDTKQHPIEDSLLLLEGVHNRWIALLKNMDTFEFEKDYLHPESPEPISLKVHLGRYAWHCLHHLEHIKIAKYK